MSTYIQQTWQDFSPTAWLERNGDNLVTAIFPDGFSDTNFSAKTFTYTHDRMVLGITAGEKMAVVKAFNGHLKSAVVARYRELSVLTALENTDLIPKVLAYDQKANWILSDFVEGVDLETHINGDNAVFFAHALGKWYAAYTIKVSMHATEEPTNWGDYLNAYDEFQRANLSDTDCELLRKLPIMKRLVAKNDSYLRNFRVDENGGVVGFDFEKAASKPYGYDILATGRILVRMFPHMMLELTEALVDGWGQGTDTISFKDMLEVTRIFALTTAFNVQHEEQNLLRQRLLGYNLRATQSADQIYQTPFMTTELVCNDPKTREGFLAYLEGAVADELSPNVPQDTEVRVVKINVEEPKGLSEAPEPSELAFCHTCAGSCCRQGFANMAFIRPHILERTKNLLGLPSLASTIEHYVNLIPDLHVGGSCFYHGPNGCVVPREQRSDVCNRYKCHALKRYQNFLTPANEEANVLLFNTDGDTVQRARILQGDTRADIDPKLLDPAL